PQRRHPDLQGRRFSVGPARGGFVSFRFVPRGPVSLPAKRRKRRKRIHLNICRARTSAEQGPEMPRKSRKQKLVRITGGHEEHCLCASERQDAGADDPAYFRSTHGPWA